MALTEKQKEKIKENYEKLENLEDLSEAVDIFTQKFDNCEVEIQQYTTGSRRIKLPPQIKQPILKVLKEEKQKLENEIENDWNCDDCENNKQY